MRYIKTICYYIPRSFFFSTQQLLDRTVTIRNNNKNKTKNKYNMKNKNVGYFYIYIYYACLHFTPPETLEK